MPTRLTGRALLQSEGIFELKKTPGAGLCVVKSCRKKIKKNGALGLCCCHYQRRWRLLNPKQNAYCQLRTRAKQRGVEFRLDYQYFLGLMDCASAWDRDAEKRGDIVTLDRKNPLLGYIPGNIVAISLSENVRKGNSERYLPAVVQAVLQRKRARVREAEETYEERLERLDLPF